MKTDTSVRHITKPTDNIFSDLGFPKDEAETLKNESVREIQKRQEIKEELFKKAVEVWKSEDAAMGFLLRPHPLLQMRAPIQAAMTDASGPKAVQDILLRLEHGIAV